MTDQYVTVEDFGSGCKIQAKLKRPDESAKEARERFLRWAWKNDRTKCWFKQGRLF